MSEIVNWVLWSIGLLAVAVALFVGIAWVIFWVTAFVTEARRNKTVIADRASEAHRWFSGFKDLDLIWDYIFGRGNHGYIGDVRDAYARARNTDVYGHPLANTEVKRRISPP